MDMTNTHILLPLKETYNIIGKMLNESFEGWTTGEKNGYMTAVATLNDFISEQGKQISLNDSDIEDKALKIYPDYTNLWQIYDAADNHLRREGYEKAFKDLLQQVCKKTTK